MEKAKESCKTSGEAVSDHFVDVNKMMPIGSLPEIHAKPLLNCAYLRKNNNMYRYTVK